MRLILTILSVLLLLLVVGCNSEAISDKRAGLMPIRTKPKTTFSMEVETKQAQESRHERAEPSY